MDCKAVIFDLDGTLLDSLGMWSEIDAAFLGRRGVTVPEDYQTAIALMRPSECAEYTINRFHLSDTPEDLTREWTEMARERYATSVSLKAGAYEFLHRLHDAGVRIGTASSLAPDMAQAALKRHGVFDLFDAFTMACELPMGKDDPALFRLAAERLGAKCEECVLYDDIAQALAVAKSTGMTTVCVWDEHSRSGYGMLDKCADRVIRSFTEEL